MKNNKFTVMHQNMTQQEMSVRDADHENDLFREAFEAAIKDENLSAEQQFFALDFFIGGWESAVRLLNDDAERATAGTTAPVPVAWRRATKHGWEYRASAPTVAMQAQGWFPLFDVAGTTAAMGIDFGKLQAIADQVDADGLFNTSGEIGEWIESARATAGNAALEKAE